MAGEHDGRARRPKIARLLAGDDAAVVRQLLITARKAGVAPTLFAGLRMATTTFVYDDPDHPDRPTSTISSPAYTVEDQALLMGMDLYESDRCECGQPRSVAWHTEMDGWFEAESFKCFACTARNDDKDVVYTIARNTRDAHEHGALPDFVLGQTTASPD